MQGNQSLPLEGKVALVTGGSRGIGAGIVRRLARDGATVAFTYASSEQQAASLVAEVEAAGGRARAIRADSASAEQIREAVSSVVKEFGLLDIFVSNAGILLRGAITEVSAEDLDRILAINVRAVVVGIQAAANAMNDDGRIMTIGSVAASRSGFAGASMYSMTKSAMVGLVHGVALDLAPRRITVNNIQPGPIATDMNPTDAAHAGMLTQLIPLGRYGQDSEVASLVSYLAGKDAAFITGSSLTVDGGYLA